MAQQAWLQGAYIKSAIQSSVLVCGLATRQAINAMPKYVEMPYKEEIEEQKVLDSKWVELERQKAWIHFTSILNAKR